MTREEYDALLKLEGTERVSVVLQNRLNPGIAKLREIVESKKLGEIKAKKGLSDILIINYG